MMIDPIIILRMLKFKNFLLLNDCIDTVSIRISENKMRLYLKLKYLENNVLATNKIIRNLFTFFNFKFLSIKIKDMQINTAK